MNEQWRRRAIAAGVCAAATLVSGGTRSIATSATVASCESLAALTIPDVQVTAATALPSGPLSVGRGGMNVPAMCRVQAVATPTPDSHIAIEIWMPPAGAWNGKLLGTYNGGFSGAIGYAAMVAAVNRGYAAVGTDTGHTGDQTDFGVGHPEKITDWSHRAIHVMTDVAKVVVRSHQGRLPDRSYFSGCSTGGQQALSEAQRYPADYDGIVAGDPGNNRLHLIYGFLWSWLVTHDAAGQTILPTSKLPAIAAASMAACDAADGIRDGIIDDPRACRFDPASMACKGDDGPGCLTPKQIDAVKKVYDGPKNPRTGAQIFPGWARGSEQGWGSYITNPREPVRLGLLKDWAFHDPNWDMRSFDWDRDVAFVDAALPSVSAMATNLSAFKARGGKLVMYTGLADPVVPPQDVINYYERVTAAMGGRAQTAAFFRFFPTPGMAHCNGGVGPNTFDALGTLEKWVEQGEAPRLIVATHTAGQQIDRSRPLCAYPQKARYKGTGSTDTAASFACADDGGGPRR
ncbi:MAG: tannase/feruloyl esterase family alpha/beta hydrolase [Acidobacteriota bacterium]